jgi:glycosyltransferase involved in cell wall biosynthesis
MTAIYSVPACKFLKIKLVNGLVVDTPVQQNIFNISWLRAQLTFPFSDMIIGNSKAGLQAYKAPKYKSSLIYNGFNFNRLNTLIDRDIIKKELKINTRFVIGMVASFSKKKDYNTFFKAAELLLLKRDDVTFIAIGNDTDSSKATNSVDPYFTSHFRFLGKRSNIESYINAMDVCVLATFTEGISNSILEYMACGKPVIATMGGGTNEIVVDNYSGYLIDPSNYKQLLEKIELLINNPFRAKEFGERGNEIVHQKFDIKLMTDNCVSVYNNVLKNQR